MLAADAIDAMEDEGYLHVRVTTCRECAGGRDGVRITIADDGSGIERDDLQHIFEPFYTTKKETGTGLGLWVSRGIVEKHRGWIRVRSRTRGQNTGTVFVIFLPLSLESGQVTPPVLSSLSHNDLQTAKVQ